MVSHGANNVTFADGTGTAASCQPRSSAVGLSAISINSVELEKAYMHSA